MEKHNLKIWVNRNRDYFYGVIVGAIAGFFYWKFVGCSSGHCMISSKPLNSMAYFAASGILIASVFKKEKDK